MFEVVVECPYGWPAVLKNAVTGRSGEPNPNLYHLSCPYLRRSIASLEDTGGIADLERLLSADSHLAAAVRAAHELHGRQWRRQAGSAPVEIRSTAIAGTATPLALKCLHAHFAWYLVHPHYNLGRLIAERLGETWCPDDYCGRSLADAGGRE